MSASWSRRNECSHEPITWPAAEAPLVAKPTRAEELRLQLADDIVRGVLAPGAALDETELANRFSVSRTPVREAIRMLGASGLVEVRPHRAAVVAKPSPSISSACSRPWPNWNRCAPATPPSA